MLKLSKITDYATVILSHLAKQPDSILTAQEISDATGITQPTVSKILKQLAKARLLISVRGAKGGYQLAYTPKSISVAQVINALEGPIALTECSTSQKNCHQVADCEIQRNWSLINQKIYAALDSVTLADLILPLKQPEEIVIPFQPYIRQKV